MAAYDTIRQIIDDNVRANGVNAITGPVMNSVLNSVMDAVARGMLFVGVADRHTEPVENDLPKFYLATAPGIYSNFVANPPLFTSGIAVITDALGTNEWDMKVYPITVNVAQTFITDARITNNVYEGDTLIYVSSATNGETSSDIVIQRTTESGGTPTTIAVITDAGRRTGFKTYEVVPSDAPSSKLNITVNWDKVPAGTTKEFGLEAALPKTAYAPLPVKETDLTNVWKRIRYAEYAIGYNNKKAEEYDPEYDGTFIERYSVAGAYPSIEIDPSNYSRGSNAFLPVGQTLVYKVNMSAGFRVNTQIKLDNIAATGSQGFFIKAIFMNYGTGSFNVNVSLSNTTDFKLIMGGTSTSDIAAGSAFMLEIYGVPRGAKNAVVSDQYSIVVLKKSLS